MTLLVERIPHRERHAEEALAANAPVAAEAVDPVLEAGAHVWRVPVQLTPARDQRLTVLDRADEPLAAGHDLHRALALLEELHRPRHRLGLAAQIARLLEQLDDAPARLVDRATLQLRVARARALDILGLPPRRPPLHLQQAPVGSEHRANRQPQLAPPHHVGQVAERAHHHQPRALVALDLLVGQHGHARAEQRRQRLTAHERAVALVVGVRQQRHARGDQLRSRRLDQRLAPAAAPAPSDRRPRPKRTRCIAPGRSRSSSSACATAVWKSTSHSVGASSW